MDTSLTQSDLDRIRAHTAEREANRPILNYATVQRDCGHREAVCYAGDVVPTGGGQCRACIVADPGFARRE
jgi:hypothetical protein